MAQKPARGQQASSNQIPDPVYISCGAHVAAIDPATGTEYWRSKLPKTTYGLISLFVQGDLIIAGSYGRIYGIDRWTGEVRWTNELTGMGYYNIMITAEGVPQGIGGMQAGVAAVAAQQAAAAASAAAASG